MGNYAFDSLRCTDSSLDLMSEDEFRNADQPRRIVEAICGRFPIVADPSCITLRTGIY